MKKISILLAENSKQKDLNFYRKVKKYVEERGHGRVFIIQLGHKNLNNGTDKFFFEDKALCSFLEKEKIDIVASSVLLGEKLLKQLRKAVIVVGAVNFEKNNDYDFKINTADYSNASLLEFSQKLSVVDKLSWDSGFFGFNIARLNHSLINENILKLTLIVCRRLAIRCLYFTSDSYSHKNVELAEKEGFRFANIRATYVLDKDIKFKKLEKAYSFRQGKKSDIPWLVDVSRGTYTGSRYYFDKNFSREICDKFYIEWVKKIANKSNKEEKVFILEKNKKPVAYIGSAMVAGTVVIELIAVDSSWRGQGIGKKIMREFVRYYQGAGYWRFKVVTQGRNIAAQRLYQSCGFEITNMEIDYHKWF